MAWTEQQQNAISARGSSVIVSAAAGSGKTAVLTERLVQLMADPESGVRADRIVVVTFTNDAASELKKRLDMKLRALISEDPSNGHLLRQQTLLQSAKISTINSFCFDLIRDNISDQGITTGFGVLDESDNTVLKARAMDELLEEMSRDEYDKISFLYDKFCIRNEKRLREVISLMDGFLASVSLREKWLDTLTSEYEKPLEDSVYYEKLRGSVASVLEKALRTSDSCMALIGWIFSDMSAAAAVKSAAQAEEDYDKVSDLLAIIRKGRIPNSEECERASSFSDLVRVGKTAHDKPLREMYKKKRESVKKLVLKAIDSIRSVESDYAESAEVSKMLADVMRKYQDIVWAMKCEKNSISFDDGERLALELLADTDENGNIIQSEAALKTSEYYDIIMIDEYQDSNNKQDLIFKLLSKNYRTDENGQPLYGDNVFLVGDVKQSIYRFRLANPRNFIGTLKSAEPYSVESDAPIKSILLNRNFRSSENVIDFVNYVFSEVMSEKCGDIDYSDDEKLYFGAEYYRGISDEKSRTVINFINDDADEEEEDGNINKEAVFTAQTIAEMLHKGTEVVGNDGSTRPCRPSDFCILVRNNVHINKYAEQLSLLGVPAKGSEESGYLRSREIAVLIDLLRVVSNPLLDIPMAAVMTSPMYMFSIRELAYIRSLEKGRPLYSVLRGLADGEYEECFDMFLRERCRDFLDSLDSFRMDSVTMTIGELISSIYDTTDFISVMQLYSDGEKKRANLRALIQYAQSYEESAAFEGSGGLGGFLRHLDKVMENGDYAQGKVAASSGDYVSVLTLHRSKGLEFPFVFIAETSTKFQYDSDIVMCSSDGRAGYILYDPKIYRKYRTFQQSILASEEERDKRSEEMRLLYVGLTRAKQKLFVDLKCGEKAMKRVRSKLESCIINDGDISEIVAEADYFSDWIWAALMHHSDFSAIAEKLGLTEAGESVPDVRCEEKLFDCVFAENISPVYIDRDEAAEKTTADEAVYTELEELVSDSYDRTLSETPAKLSVTEITKKLKQESDNFDYKLKRPRF
ncbi:MAG: UvrD-helicase domain-containing protein, partial [Ruminococcus flavefaciens]